MKFTATDGIAAGIPQMPFEDAPESELKKRK